MSLPIFIAFNRQSSTGKGINLKHLFSVFLFTRKNKNKKLKFKIKLIYQKRKFKNRKFTTIFV